MSYSGPERRWDGTERRRAPQPAHPKTTNELLARGLVAVVVLLVLGIFMAWWSSYSGRQNVVENQRNGCERGKLDRRANATGWRTAEAARRQTAENPDVAPSERIAARIAADRYQEIADALDARSRIDCKDVFPDAALFEFTDTEPRPREDRIADEQLWRALAVAATKIKREGEAAATLRRSPDDP